MNWEKQLASMLEASHLDPETMADFGVAYASETGDPSFITDGLILDGLILGYYHFSARTTLFMRWTCLYDISTATASSKSETSYAMTYGPSFSDSCTRLTHVASSTSEVGLLKRGCSFSSGVTDSKSRCSDVKRPF